MAETNAHHISFDIIHIVFHISISGTAARLLSRRRWRVWCVRDGRSNQAPSTSPGCPYLGRTDGCGGGTMYRDEALCCAVLLGVVLCFVVECCSLLCCAALFFVVLYCVVLCCSEGVVNCAVLLLFPMF